VMSIRKTCQTQLTICLFECEFDEKETPNKQQQKSNNQLYELTLHSNSVVDETIEQALKLSNKERLHAI
jgi:hypothetical protein